MVRKFAIPILMVGTLTLVAVFGALTYQNVAAQEDAPTPTTPSQELPGKGLRGRHIDQTNEDLATALGITVDELDAAKESAAAEALKQAVEAGLLTQDQADQMAERGLSGRGIPGLDRMGENSIDYQALLAEALGISVNKLEEAQQTAQDAALARAVEAGTLTQEQADLIQACLALYGSDKFQASMQSAFEAAVAQAVDDGSITQAQADQILTENAGRSFFGRGGLDFNRGGERGGRHGHPGFETPPGSQPQTDDTTSSDL